VRRYRAAICKGPSRRRGLLALAALVTRARNLKVKSARRYIEHGRERAVNDPAAREPLDGRASATLINWRNTPRLYKSEFGDFVATPNAGIFWNRRSVVCRQNLLQVNPGACRRGFEPLLVIREQMSLLDQFPHRFFESADFLVALWIGIRSHDPIFSHKGCT